VAAGPGAVARACSAACHAGRVREVRITGDSIRLGQLLKLADVVDAGSDVKEVLASGQVTVNGEVETRRGRQLVRGDEVSTRAEDIRVV
jgi:ribosome-associated protein